MKQDTFSTKLSLATINWLLHLWLLLALIVAIAFSVRTLWIGILVGWAVVFIPVGTIAILGKANLPARQWAALIRSLLFACWSPLWLLLGIYFYQNHQYLETVAAHQLQEILITIPDNPACKKVLRSHFCHFPAAPHLALNCGNQDDTCRQAYAFAGQKGVLGYYQQRVYRLDIANHAVYRMDRQNEIYRTERLELMRALWFTLLYSLPFIWFYRQYRRLASSFDADAVSPER